MVTRVTLPANKKAPYGLTPGKTYVAEMMAFVKVHLRSSYVEPAWRLMDDFGRNRWVPVELFEPTGSQSDGWSQVLPQQSHAMQTAYSFTDSHSDPVMASNDNPLDDDLAAQWEAALSAAS